MKFGKVEKKIVNSISTNYVARSNIDLLLILKG